MRAVALSLAAAGAGAAPDAPTCRDRFVQPFNSTSIWNHPVGSGAVYVPANIYTNSFNTTWACHLRDTAPSRRRQCAGAPANATEDACVAAGCCFNTFAPNKSPTCYKPAGGLPDYGFHADQDIIIRALPGDPETPFLDRAWVSPPHCCDVSGPQKGTLPFPADFVTDCELNNNAAAVILPDNVTVRQFQPLYRGAPGEPIMAQYPPSSPYPGFLPGWNVSLLEDGLWGAHGGSFLSSIGGTIRAGELLPGTGPIPHALKLEVYAHDYYWAGFTGSPCFTWPALDCDGYCRSGGDGGYNGTLPIMKPGSLLAVPPSLAPGVVVSTVAGRKILDALTTYGGYLVDDTAGDSGAVCMEPAAIADLGGAYGISMNITHSALPMSPGATGAFFYDLLAIFQALAVVANNGPGDMIGGGGQPLVPLAPPLCQ